MEKTLDIMAMIKRYNKAVCEAKLGFHLMFPEPYGSYVHIICTYNGNDKNKGRNNACVIDLINVNNPGKYEDIDENNKPVNHMWLQNVFNPANRQVSIWENLQIGDTLVLTGILSEYPSKEILKIGIESPIILQAFRNNKEFYRNNEYLY